MRELLYTILELEEWNQGVNCSFCSNSDNKAVCQIRTRNKLTDKMLENDEACEECKEKFENGELPKCESCGRLKTKLNTDFFSGNYTCDCEKEMQEKELSPSPPREGMASFYERQINALQEEKAHLVVESQTHLDAMEAFEVYNKKHRQELLDRIKELEEENKRLKEKIKKITLEEELTNKMLVYEKEIAELKEQVVQLSKQQTTQIEITAKRQKY